MITCAKCSKENQDHYKFCLGCGAELPRDTAPKAFSPKTPPHGMKSAAAAPPPAPPAFAPPPAAPRPPAAAPAAPPPAPPAAVAAPAPAPRPVPIAAPPAAPAPAPAPAVAAASGTSPCPTCGHPNPPNNKFCASCGTVLTGGSVPMAAPAAAPPVASGPSTVTLTALRADGSDAGTYQLPGGSTTIGRDLGGIFGGDSYLSPKHATFNVQGGRVTVRDETSLNGVYLKVARDTPTELKPGEIFRIGQEIIRFERLAPPAPSPDGVERMGSPNEGIIGRLSLLTGRDSTGNSFTIPAHGVHLGRERGDVIFPEDGYVSGLHCRVAAEAGRVFLTDLGSSNGTYVRLNEEKEIRSGDILLMGQQLFRVGA